MSAAVEPLRVGVTFHGRYEILRVIKSGGMGTVYEAIDRVTRRSRALKTMLPDLVADHDLLSRFRLEATIAAEVDSRHIVEIFDAGIDDTTSLPYLVMELLKGQDLGALLEARGRLDPAEVAVYLRQAALALDKIHAAGIVHRDLKPENLFLTTLDDGSAHLKLLDFGIAKLISQSGAAKTTRNVGTPLYMSPEQILGDGAIGAASDRYACGQIAFSLLVGQSYWAPEAATSSGAASLLVRVLQGQPEPATARASKLGADLPPGFDAWFARATAAEPERRFPSMREQVDSLAALLGVPWESGQASLEANAPPRSKLRRRPNPHAAARRLLGLAALALALLASLGALGLWQASTRAEKQEQVSERSPPTRTANAQRTDRSTNASETATEVVLRPAVPMTSDSLPALPATAMQVVRPPSGSQARRGAGHSAENPRPPIDPTDIR